MFPRHEGCPWSRPGQPFAEGDRVTPLIGFQVCEVSIRVTYFRAHSLEPNFVLRSDDCGTIAAFVERDSARLFAIDAEAVMPHATHQAC